MADPRIQLIAFDLGGVLIRVDKRIDQSFFVGNTFDQFTRGLISPSDFFEKVAIRTPKRVAQLESEFKNMVSPIDQLTDLLASLRRPYTLWSNINQSHFSHLLECCPGLCSHEASLAGLSFQLDLKKPDEKFFQACLDLAKLDPNQILFLDDDRRNVQAAQKMGIHGHHVSSYHSLISKLKGESLLA